MSKRFRIIGLCLAAVFALSAVAASSASAAGWEECSQNTKLEFKNSLCNEAGPPNEWGWEPITQTKNVLTEGTLVLSNKTLLGTIRIRCKGIDTGNVGPGSKDVISKIESTKKTVPIQCELLEGGILCTAPVNAEPTNLPWLTELESATKDILKGHDSTKNPGWRVVCNNGTADTCTKATAVLAVTNKANGTVDTTFNEAEKATCENGEGKVAGTVTNKLANGNGLRVK